MQGAAVARERGDADEGGDLPPIEVPELGDIAEQRRGQGGPDAGHTLEQLVLDPPERARGDELLQRVVRVRQTLFQPVNVAAEIGAHPAVAGGVALPLGVQHVEQLAATAKQGLQLLGRGIGERPHGRLDAGAEEGEDRGVDRVGLGESAGGLGEIADLARIDDHDRQAGARQGGDHRRFVAPGGLEHHQRDRRRLTLGHERGQPRVIRGKGPRPPRGLAGEHHGVFRDIDADDHTPSHVTVATARPCGCGVDSGQRCGLDRPGPGGPQLTCGLRPRGTTGSSHSQLTVRARHKGPAQR